jgi:nucleoside-diphosphate-sugar epimerase
MDRTSNILLTGGAGFIGTYLSRELHDLGHNIRVVDIDKKNMLNPAYDNRVLDILDRNGLTNAMKEMDLVIHLAAKHRFFGVSEREFFLVNEEGTRNVLQAMDVEGVKKLVFYSTVAVYGEANDPTDENTETKPNTPYALSKLAAEDWIKKWAANDPARTAIIIRPTVIFGPNNKGNIYRPIGEGHNIKSIACVENVIASTVFLMNQDKRGLEVYNYADSPHMPYKEIVNLIYAGLSREVPRYHLPLTPMLRLAKALDKMVDMAGLEFSVKTTIEKMNKSTHHRTEKIRQLGFLPCFSSKEGLKRMVDWYIAEKTNRKRAEADDQ